MSATTKGTPSPSSAGATPPALGPERAVSWPRRTVRTLANGMQVVLAEQHIFPKIHADLFFRSGNALVAHRSPDLAELTARLVRTGTKSHTSHQIEEELRRMGANLGTSAGADTSGISISGLAESTDGLLAMISELARNASFPAEEFERERRQRLEELRIERTTPDFLAGERLRHELFGEHPYAVISPSEEQLAGYHRDALESYYRENYVPANALLVAVGDFDAGKMMERIEKTFGEWKAASAPLLEGAAPPVAHGRTVHLVHLPGTVQAEILIGNLALTRQSPDWKRAVLANTIYGGAFNSRLVTNIREQKGYTYSPRSTLNALRQHGFFTVHAAVRSEVVAATLAEIFYELDRLRALPVGESELDDARNYLCGVFSLGIATQGGLLGQISSVYLNGLADDYLETFREKIRALTAQDVLAAARRYFDSANSRIVVVGDREQVEPQVALFGDVTVWDAQGKRM
jgi:zinc protease